jgi:hypothetical protein
MSLLLERSKRKVAERRMFAKTIIDSDAFLDMPQSTQLLYFHLSMRADDDGFINNPKKIQRMIGCSEDDLKILITKKFIITFESGVIVIKHWKIHNYIRNDRYKETTYKEEKSTLILDENNAYTSGIPDVYQMDTQVRLGKDSIGKDSIGNKKEKKSTEIDDLINSNFKDEELRNTVYEFIKMRKVIKKPLTTRGLELMIKKLCGMTTNIDEQIEILNNSIMNNWQGIFPLKQNTKVKNAMEEFLNG